MDAYRYCTAAWLGLQGLPLVVAPKLVIAMLASEVHITTALEIYFCRSLAFALFTVAIMTVFLAGSAASTGMSYDETDARAPFAIPMIAATTSFHFASLISCYVRWLHDGQAGFFLGATGYGLMTAYGLWCLIFGGASPRLSKRTGADKRTTGFPFKNAAAYDKKSDRQQI